MIARVWIKQGRIKDALIWSNTVVVSQNDISYLNEFKYITIVRLLIAQYKISTEDIFIVWALELIDRLLDEAIQDDRMGVVIEILILKSLLHKEQKNISHALVPLERALKISETAGFFQIFVDEGPAMNHLLTEAASQSIMPDYTAKLLTAFPSGKQNSKMDFQLSALQINQPLLDPLSRRELEILQLIAEGYSNSDICKKLYIALSTIKGHNFRIFSKLQVNRRTEAVARARKLGLIQH